MSWGPIKASLFTIFKMKKPQGKQVELPLFLWKKIKPLQMPLGEKKIFPTSKSNIEARGKVTIKTVKKMETKI